MRKTKTAKKTKDSPPSRNTGKRQSRIRPSVIAGKCRHGRQVGSGRRLIRNGQSLPKSEGSRTGRSKGTDRGKTFYSPVQRGNGSHPALNEVQKLYEFMQQNRLETLEFNKDDMHVRLVRQSSGRIPVPVNITAPAVEQPRQAVHDTVRAPVMPIKGIRIKSPLTGIFYRAPSPSSPPFVKDGDTVHAGQVVCIIEAMKVFNEVKAETDCTILKVLVENGKPVTANHDLFIIEKK